MPHDLSVYISLTSFGAAEVRRHGQEWFTHLSHAAGADGVEVREELLVDATHELPALADTLRRLALTGVYSCPTGLWQADGTLDEQTLDRAMARTSDLGATQLKMSIGVFNAASVATLPLLARRLATGGPTLTIENDQTEQAGTRVALQHFFDATDAIGLDLPMTFDVGNWHWTGECPQQMAALFAARVRYVHCKGVQRQPQRWVAVPLADSAAPWRTIVHAMPTDVPWAIEYPLVGDDLTAVTRTQIDHLRATARHQQGQPA